MSLRDAIAATTAACFESRSSIVTTTRQRTSVAFPEARMLVAAATIAVARLATTLARSANDRDPPTA
jgi:hypothetical protein